jgi:hypothetical protein
MFYSIRARYNLPYILMSTPWILTAEHHPTKGGFVPTTPESSFVFFFPIRFLTAHAQPLE